MSYPVGILCVILSRHLFVEAETEHCHSQMHPGEFDLASEGEYLPLDYLGAAKSADMLQP